MHDDGRVPSNVRVSGNFDRAMTDIVVPGRTCNPLVRHPFTLQQQFGYESAQVR